MDNDMIQKLAEIAENCRDAIIGKDRDGIITSWNKGAEEMYGYAPKEVIGKKIDIIIPEDKRQELSEIFQTLQQGGSIHNLETKRITKAKELIDIALTISPVKNEDEKLTGYALVARDITAMKKAELALREQEEQFRCIIEYSPNAIVVVDQTGKIVLVNEMTEKIFLYGRQELLGESINILIPKEVHTEHNKYRDQFMKKPSERSMGSGRDLYAINKENEKIPVEIGLNPIRTEKNNWVLASIIDIRERKKAEEKITQINALLTESNKDLEQFAFIASHDLQEPLRIVASYVQLFSQKYKGRLDDQADKYINYIITNTSRLQQMISDLLDYSRIGKKEQPLEWLDTNKACDQAISNLAITIKKKKAKIVHDTLPAVYSREVDLIRIFQNLINNAIKYCDKEKPYVHVKAQENNKSWIFIVEDNGIGIDEEFKSQIFEIFKRLHTRSEFSGSGMGLSICKKIIEHNGGCIWVESQLNIGSRFCFSLPKMKEAAYEHTT